MNNTLFDVSVYAFDLGADRVKDVYRIYGRDNAVQYGKRLGICDNVERVDVTDSFTGELIMGMENGEVSWMADWDKPMTTI